MGLLANPVADGDAGEYVRLVLPAGNWTVSDGEDAASFRLTRSGTVLVVAPDESVVDPPPGRVVAGDLSLSNGGERVVLRHGGPEGAVVDAVEYGDAPEGERWIRARTGGTSDDGVGGSAGPWRPVGYEPRSPESLGAADATAFVLPDAPGVPVEPIRRADERVLLAGYTYASERLTRELIAARDRGVTARVLLDGGPVGGVTDDQARLLDRLVAAGVEVRVVAGPRARFRYHHAKYAVADDAAVVLTENWKPSGTGGADSRGWGVVLRSARSADALAALFRSDTRQRDAVPWTEFRAGRTFTDADPSNGSYPRRTDPRDLRVERATLLTAPGNAEAGVVAAIDGADERVDVLQPTVEPGPLLAATRRAARRGATVRLLLSNAWYVADENRATVEELNRWAERAGVPFEARVVDPGGRFGKVHAKGVVADDVAVVGSLNWNPTSAGENREVVVALRGDAVADYYRSSFAADWRGGRGGPGGGDAGAVPPALAVAAVGLAAGVVLFLRRRLAFGDGEGDGGAVATDDERGPIG
ncbi:phospholipase D-like domain-containing protein [Halobaculum lipolyticum]|uniref:Phospholipase D-like domain-containing protein n=1 Tax=Halobaculum lipolyticum TaxID=3032001 RepID=A0ABD5WAE1_9EURY|nr:phospholipase D-like domain-containing protein [Halobaculum sp. DT31]